MISAGYFLGLACNPEERKCNAAMETAKNLIRRRTSKIIGGYITENLFREKYLEVFKGRACSTGWWAGIELSKNQTLTFLVVKNELNDLDLKVIARLQSKGYLWKQVINDNGTLYVRDSESRMTASDYVKMRGLEPFHISGYVYPLHTDDANLEKCIELFEQEGKLDEIASGIYVEDSFLNQYYTISNIDLICENEEGIPVYVEIKFKNEFQTHFKDKNINSKMVFGIDRFQYEKLFRVFVNCGMEVLNAVLYNDIKHTHNIDTTLIFDFLEEKGDQKLFWKVKKIDPYTVYPTSTSSHGVTGWYGKRERTVYCIPLKEYRDFDEFTLPGKYANIYPEGSWGTCPVCGEPLVIRTNHTTGSEFMGGLDYRKHLNCRKQLKAKR